MKIDESPKSSSLTASREPSAPAAVDDSLDRMLKGGRRRNRARRVLLVVVSLAVIALGIFGALQWRKGAEEGKGPRYITEKVKKGDLTSTISATGTVQALNTVEVGAEISGRILSLHADFNDAVTAGQVLAEIDPEQLEAALAQSKAQMLAAQAQVAEAEATLAENERELERSRELAAKGLLSSKEKESAEAKAVRASASLKSAKASAALSKASFDAARSKLSKTKIICPINGAVLSRAVEVGQTINAGMQTPVLFTIAEDLKHMQLSSRVDEADIGSVAVGQSASFTVDAHPSRKFASSVTSVRNVPNTDQNVVSYEVLLSVDNQEMLLKPGMTASVEIIIEKHSDMVLVPNKALRFSPPREDFRMRGPPMPLLGNAGRKGTKKADTSASVEDLGKLGGNQGVLWVLDKGAAKTGAGIRPIKVEKLATDGVMTAIKSDAIEVGQNVVVEMAEAERK